MYGLNLSFLKEAVENPKVLKSDKSWMSHIKPILASVKFKNVVSSDSLFQYLKQDIELANGYTTEHVRLIYTILANHNRSDYLPPSITQVSAPQYSAAVPIGLAAYREAHGIKYSTWKLNNPFMDAALLGKSLADILRVRSYLINLSENGPVIKNDSEVGNQEALDSMGTSSSEKNEVIDPFDTANQAEWRKSALGNGTINSRMVTSIKRVFGSGHPLGNTLLPKFYWYMLTQTWIFEPKIRHPDMITNLLDWDTPAEPLDSFTELLETKKPTSKGGWY